MKNIICCILLGMLITLDLSQGKDSAEDMHPEYCDAETEADAQEKCVQHKCNKENTKISTMFCPEVMCPGNINGYKGDKSKPYPQCCVEPICDLSARSV